ncbi:hypothetical protein [Shinella pollutisoli]|uniref:DUF1127 domain-containing protein n=1 Tax=Shinella pollutisoli TaxID=2250594 RepID=A0ABV7DJ57_9HYPH|nr:hypothetical protein [Shinella pollutisoli]
MSAPPATFTVAFPSGGLLSALRRLWEERTIRVDPVKDLDKLSDHLLADIGVDPRAVHDPMRDEADRLHLMRHGFSRL